LIETVIIYKLPRPSREEIQAMLQVHDIRETRVYQEAKKEGFQEGVEKERQRSRQQKLAAIAKMSTKMSPAEIADALSLDVDLVKNTLAKKGKKRP
jgi:predicted transposase YdaD